MKRVSVSDDPLPEAGIFLLVELWAHLTPLPLGMHPLEAGEGSAGHLPGGRTTDPVSPLEPCWLLQGKRCKSFREAGEEATSSFDPLTSALFFQSEQVDSVQASFSAVALKKRCSWRFWSSGWSGIGFRECAGLSSEHFYGREKKGQMGECKVRGWRQQTLQFIAPGIVHVYNIDAIP